MDQQALTSLTSGLRGEVITPGDEGYDEARRVWNGTVAKRPALIVKCSGVADVIDAVKFAKASDLGVSVRGGGHHVAGAALIEGGLVIDLSPMRSVRVDLESRTVRAEGGALLGDVDRETQAFGLAVPLGLFSDTGIAGLTLAGGYGWLRRKYGLSCDNLISADVVTAEGRLVKASATENADLFWALRGGGWDLGVVTSFEFRAYLVSAEMFFVFVTYPVADTRSVLAGFHRFMETAPREASPIAVVWTLPASEPYPEEVWGQSFVGIAGPYDAPPSEGEPAMQPLRELGTPLLDMSGAMPYTMIQRLFDEEYPKGRRYYWKSTYLRDLDEAAISELSKIGGQRPSPLTSLDVWPLGGAVSDVRSGDSVVGHRDAKYLIGLESNWEDAAQDAANIAWARDGQAALAPHSTGGSYLNFEDLSETNVVAASHGPSLARLIEVKRKYDANNLFRSRRGLVD
ncbi:MAG: linked oxidase domain protein [Chloroflexi bacterium]|nr:linked oxidase domain protein [Chloroflexota bacterium]